MLRRLLLTTLLPLFCLALMPGNPPEVAGSWRMTAHRVDPALDGITDLYTHFKDLYGGCREDMGLVLNTDGTLKMSPVKGCQNPLGNVIMKAASKFMPSGNKASWEASGTKLILQDGKGQRKEYDLQVSDAGMQWGFDETSKGNTVRHTVEFKRE
ncbi:hypothetical protein GCM10027299_10680 [Larkinella ripae]